MQPHLVQVQFQRKVKIQHVAMFLDYSMDESYTPNRIAIRVGTSFYDLKEVRVIDLEEPKGWIIIPLHEPGQLRH
jgi:anaphase-promoting complex subunit 10